MRATPLKVLIVDDNPDDRIVYRRLLEQIVGGKYQLFEAGLGADGLRLCELEKPDCILLDYNLPDLDGVEFLKSLMRENGTSSVPTIVLTGQGSESLAAETFLCGAADYVPKNTLSSKCLERAIGNAVERFALRTALEAQRRSIEEKNEDLTRRNAEIQCFYHMLSHELKTPLTAAAEFASILLDGLAGPLTDDQRDYIGIVKDSCDQMTLGLNDLLDTTRLDTGNLQIAPRSCNIQEVAARTVASLEGRASDGGVRLYSSFAPDLPEVLIDSPRIIQVLTNLLTNALKFTSRGGEVIVEVDVDPDSPQWVRVAVRDSGCGMPVSDLDRVFSRLYQVKAEDSEISGGWGMGLHICEGLVSLHGGRIWAESELGAGSTFFFTLPIRLVAETAQLTETEEA